MKTYLPKKIEHFFSFYPGILSVSVLSLIVLFIFSPSLLKLGCLIFLVYFCSPLIWRLMSLFFHQPKSVSRIGKNAIEGNMWMIAFQLQQFYNALPFLESLLKIIPGLYSAWLRLWGCRIGAKVNWTPGCQVVDRTLLEVGDRCLIGNMSYISGHAIKKKDDTYILFIKKVIIGNDCVISYSSTLSPGSVMGDRSFLEAGGVLYPNYKLNAGEKYERFQELSH